MAMRLAQPFFFISCPNNTFSPPPYARPSRNSTAGRVAKWSRPRGGAAEGEPSRRGNNLDNNETVIYTYDNSGNILSKTKHPYTIGDVIGILDSTGATLVEYSYDAWGKATVSYGDTVDLTETEKEARYFLGTNNAFRYRGYYFDVETGFYYLNTRYYDPEIGRCISPDTTDVLTATPTDVTDKNLFAYCDNNPVMRSDQGGRFWNIVIGAVVGATINMVSSIISEAIEGDFTWKDVGQIAISTVIGAAEGALTAVCPAASSAISAVASATDTAINGIIDGDSAEEIVTNTLLSSAIGAVGGSGGSDFIKGGKLINDAVGAIGNIAKKGVPPAVKQAARKLIKKAAKNVWKSYASGQMEDFAYGAIYEFSSFYTGTFIHRYG